jgi:hypothetical protein
LPFKRLDGILLCPAPQFFYPTSCDDTRGFCLSATVQGVQ